MLLPLQHPPAPPFLRRYGEADEVSALIAAGADVNAVDEGGSSALHKAAANGHAVVVEVGSPLGVPGSGGAGAARVTAGAGAQWGWLGWPGVSRMEEASQP